jgi:hypothetical protein
MADRYELTADPKHPVLNAPYFSAGQLGLLGNKAGLEMVIELCQDALKNRASADRRVSPSGEWVGFIVSCHEVHYEARSEDA